MYLSSHRTQANTSHFQACLIQLLAILFTLNICLTINPYSYEYNPHEFSKRQQSQLDDWIRVQVNQSWSAILANISPHSALTGTIVASLSTSEPDYFYTWTRDAAIVLKEIVARYEESNDPELLLLIQQTLSATQNIQNQSRNGSTLGEPKYYVNNGSAYLGPSNRPQRDGPALRAMVYIKFARAYLKVGGQEAADYVKRVLYDGQWQSRSVIKADLEYIANSWGEKSFDLWEEVNGQHFFTLVVIQRALKDGARFSSQMNDPGATNWYQQQADEIGAQLKLFWNSEAGHILASRNFAESNGTRSGLDVGTILGCLHAGLQAPNEYRPDSSQMLATFNALLKSMVSLYPINSRYSNFIAKAIGRYPEDVYDGLAMSVGNPWFVATLSMAEYLYRVPTGAVGDLTIANQTTDRSMRTIGDEFVTIVRDVIATNGSLHEQFDRVNGSGRGARDLSWSHVAFLSMDRARRGMPEF